MRTAAKAGNAARALVGTGAVVIAMAVASTVAGPSWANPTPMHHQPPPSTPTTTTPSTPTTTTASPGPPPGPPAPAPPDNCVRGQWPQAVQGRPDAFQAGDGVYLWHDPDGGWALRVTRSGPRDRVPFSGYLTSVKGSFVDVVPFVGNGNDIVAVSADKQTVYFRFVGYGLVDGLDFATQCTRAFVVEIHMGGSRVPTGSIYLGANLVDPTSNPFRIARDRGDASDITLTGSTTTSLPTAPLPAPAAA